jgi:LPPG:FO 2-phospho-L-lactate transferase
VKVALLAGGTGGGKLAAGLQALVGEQLSVIANTGDDVELLGVHVSPDPDLVTYWLADEIDEDRGWGIRDDGFAAFERLARFGMPDWFALGDRDLAACLYRRHFLDEGGTQTAAQAQIARALGVRAAVLPMSEQAVRTRVGTTAGWRDVQEYLIIDRAELDVEVVELQGIETALPTPEVVAAIAAAELIVIGPSNPVISIGPILAIGGIREAVASAAAPVLAVSPFVAGRVVKGPTAKFMVAVGRPSNSAGIADLYAGLLDGIVVDEGDPDPQPESLPSRLVATLMTDARSRRRVAEAVLDFGATLAAR